MTGLSEKAQNWRMRDAVVGYHWECEEAGGIAEVVGFKDTPLWQWSRH